MSRSWFSALACLIFLLSCKNSSESKRQFYPIGLFLAHELSIFDSNATIINKYHSDEKCSDTTIMNRKDFREFVTSLLLNPITSEGMMDQYVEITIQDLTLDFITFNYNSSENNMHTIELHIDPATERVKSLYVEISEKDWKNTTTKKILWTSNKQLLVNTIYSTQNRITYGTDLYKWTIMDSK